MVRRIFGTERGEAMVAGRLVIRSMMASLVLVAACGGQPHAPTLSRGTPIADASVPDANVGPDTVDAAGSQDVSAETNVVDGGLPDRPSTDAAVDTAVDARPTDTAVQNDLAFDAQATDAVAVDGPAQSGPRALSLVLANAPWFSTQATQGIAVDATNHVFVGDADYIYVIDGKSDTNSAKALPYLSAAEAAGTGPSNASLGDFDIGPDGRLYVALSSSPDGGAATSLIVRSAAPHQATPWVSTDVVMRRRKVAVVSDSVLAMVADDGVWKFTDAGGQKIYSASAARVPNGGCAAEDFAAAPSGVFLYQPGCNVYPIVRGNIDGSGVGELYQASLPSTGPIPAVNFLCSGRDPSGGFYVVIDNYLENAPRLYHLAEDAQGATGVTWIQTVPTFGQAKASQGETFGFYFCSVAAAPDGTVFVQTYHQLWKVSP